MKFRAVTYSLRSDNSNELLNRVMGREILETFDQQSPVNPPGEWRLVGNSYAELGADFAVKVEAATTSSPQWLAFNYELASSLGIYSSNDNGLPDVHFFTGEAVISGAVNVAQAYAGHQFGSFNPSLGDGRAMLLGDAANACGELSSIQLKGSGPTPFSRRGDGKSALGPVIREYIVSEAMHRLGVPTTRALAAVITGDMVYRERAMPGGVMTRVASSHIRVGTFEYFAARGMIEQLKILADYTIDRHYPDCKAADQPYLELMRQVQARQASLVAQWLQLGFVHGVMNTDNMSVAGETIDYGPCAFIDRFSERASFSSIDTHGRYAYNQQALIANWNLARFAECLIPLVALPQEQTVAELEYILKTFPEQHAAALAKGWRAKFGLAPDELTNSDVIQLANDFKALMATTAADFTMSFRRLGTLARDSFINEWAYDFAGQSELATSWLVRWQNASSRKLSERGELMCSVNPGVIPRNHQVERVIDEVYARVAARESADVVCQPVVEMLAAVTNPFSAESDQSKFVNPPGDGGEGYRTFCGT